MTRRLLGVIFFFTIFFFGSLYVKDWYFSLFGKNTSFIEVDGFPTIWSIASAFLFGGSMTVVFLFAKMDWMEKKVNIIVVIVCFFLAPITSGVVLFELNKKISSFVECRELRHSSRLHSSKTYAITPQECLRLVSDREAREL